MTNFQRELYQFYLDNISTKGEKAVNNKGRSVSGLFTDYQNLMRVWTHPKLLETHSLKREFAELLIEKVKRRFVTSTFQLPVGLLNRKLEIFYLNFFL